MTTGDWALALVLIIVAIAGVLYYIAWKVAFDDGFEAGQLHERNLRSTRLIREHREDRTERATRQIWGPEVDDFDQWAASLRDDKSERLADTGELRLALSEHIGPVAAAAVVDDMTFACDGVNWQETERATRAIASTGELRIRTDRFIANMTESEAAYRDGITS
jgi:hypothetical protein